MKPFNHSTLPPLVILIPWLPAVNSVTSLRRIAASSELVATTLPSTKTPPPPGAVVG